MPRSRRRGPGWWKELSAFLLPELISRLKGSDSSASTKRTLKWLLLPGESGPSDGKNNESKKKSTAVSHAGCPMPSWPPCLAAQCCPVSREEAGVKQRWSGLAGGPSRTSPRRQHGRGSRGSSSLAPCVINSRQNSFGSDCRPWPRGKFKGSSINHLRDGNYSRRGFRGSFRNCAGNSSWIDSRQVLGFRWGEAMLESALEVGREVAPQLAKA